MEEPTEAAESLEADGIASPLLGRVEGSDLRVLSSEAVLWFTGVLLVLAGSLYFTHTNWSAWSPETRSLVSASGLGLYGAGFAGLAYLVARRSVEQLRHAPERILGAVSVALVPIVGVALSQLGRGDPSAVQLLIAALAGATSLAGAAAVAHRVDPEGGGGIVVASASALVAISILGAVFETSFAGVVGGVAAATIAACLAGRVADVEKPSRALGIAALTYAFAAVAAASVVGVDRSLAQQMLGAFLALFALALTARPRSGAGRVLSIAGAFVAVPLVLSGPLAPVGSRVAVLVAAVLATSTLLRVARAAESRLAAVGAATFGLVAYYFSPAPFNVVLDLLLGAAKRAFGYESSPLPLPFFALTFFPYLALIAWIAIHLRSRASKLSRSVETWLLVATLAVSALALSGSDPRPAILSLPLYAIGFAAFARRKASPWLLQLSLLATAFALARGLEGLGLASAGLALLSFVWPVVARSIVPRAERSALVSSAAVAAIAASMAFDDGRLADGAALGIAGIGLVRTAFALDRGFLAAAGALLFASAFATSASGFRDERLFESPILLGIVLVTGLIHARRTWAWVLFVWVGAADVLVGIEAARAFGLEGGAVLTLTALIALADAAVGLALARWKLEPREPTNAAPRVASHVPSLVAALILCAIGLVAWFDRAPVSALGISVLAAILVSARARASVPAFLAGALESAIGLLLGAAAFGGSLGFGVAAVLLSLVEADSKGRRHAHRLVAAVGFSLAAYGIREHLAGLEATLTFSFLAVAALAAARREPTRARSVIAAHVTLAALASAAIAIPLRLGLPGEWMGQLPFVAAVALVSSMLLSAISRESFVARSVGASLEASSRLWIALAFFVSLVDALTRSSTGTAHVLLYVDFAVIFLLSVGAARATGRARYAFLAEAVLAATWAKLRSKGWLFPGSENADAVFMLVGAFVSTGAHALACRRGARAFEVAAKWTVLLLPPLAVLAGRPEPTFEDAGIALCAAAVYALADRVGTSRIAGPLAALMLNLATSLTWIRTGVSTPQAHVLPLAASVLVLAHVHRDQLSVHASAWIRLVALGGAYLSGFVTLLAFDAPGEALIMAVACVAGIALGALFRIKSYLFLGAGFLIADLGTNIVRFGLSGHAATTIVLTGLGLTVIGAMVTWSLNREQIAARMDALRHELALWST